MRHWIRTLLALLALHAASAGAAPVCDVAMSQPVYIVNELVRISTLRYSNLSESSLPVRLRLQLQLPTGSVVNALDLGANGSLVMPPGFDRILSPIGVFAVGTQPRGTYQFRCALEDPVTGAVLVEDTTAFELPQFPDRHPILLEYGFDSTDPDATFNPMSIVVFEEVGPQLQNQATASSCDTWVADAPVTMDGAREEATFQRIDIETPGCGPSVITDELYLGRFGTVPYSVSVTSASLHYQPFGAQIQPDGSFASDQPAMFHLIGTVQIQGQSMPFDVLAPAINNVGGAEPSGTFTFSDDSDDIGLEHLSVRALTVSVPGNRAPALFETTVGAGIPVALRIGGRFTGTLGSAIATPVPIP